MLEQRLQHQFFEAADLMNQVAEQLSKPLADAALALAGAITGGGKVLVAGSDVGVFLAPVLVSALCGRFERERPVLAAVCLRHEAPFQLDLQVQALGHPGDVLVLLDGGGAQAPLLQAAKAAQERDMMVLVLTGPSARVWQGLLAETDALLRVPHERAARVAEVHLSLLHALCDAVDLQLLGELESE